MGISSSKSSTISIRRESADAAPPAAEEATGEGEDPNVTVIILGPRWVRDRNTGQQYVEKNRRRIDMLERRGEVTHVLREQGKRFFTRHKDGTMQMDPKRASVGGCIWQALKIAKCLLRADEAVVVEVPAGAPAVTEVAPGFAYTGFDVRRGKSDRTPNNQSSEILVHSRESRPHSNHSINSSRRPFLKPLKQCSSFPNLESYRYQAHPSQAIRMSGPSLGIEELWNLISVPANIQVLDDHLLSTHPTFETPPDRQQPWVRMAVSKNSDGTFQGMLLERGVLFAETKRCPSPYEAVLEMFEHTSSLVAMFLARETHALRHGEQKDDETVVRLDLIRRKPGECFEKVCKKWTDDKGRRRSSAQELEKDVMRGV
ncbi:unnamed protein product, partial [Aureobasidium mustum]